MRDTVVKACLQGFHVIQVEHQVFEVVGKANLGEERGANIAVDV